MLRTAAAASLPAEHARPATGVPIGPRRRVLRDRRVLRQAPIVVEDIAVDPRWENYREIAVDHGLQACWSTPVLASSGDRVLGTFAV